jgi:integrase/recombinase XerD
LRRYLSARFTHFPNISTRALFITEFGMPLRDQSFRHRLEHYAKKAGITGVKVSPHSLRFTFIRRWLAKGGDSIILQRIVGHSSPAMVSYYAKLFAQDLKSVHAKVNPLEGLPSAQKRLLGISGRKTKVRFKL